MSTIATVEDVCSPIRINQRCHAKRNDPRCKEIIDETAVDNLQPTAGSNVAN